MMSTRTTAYYDATASRYDQLHGGDRDPEHIRALERSWPLIKRLAIESALDVGCGTGRSLQWLKCKDRPVPQPTSNADSIASRLMSGQLLSKARMCSGSL